MLKFIARHWRGEANIWLSVVVFSIVLPLGVIVLGSKWVGHTLQDTPQWRMIQAAVFFVYPAGRHMARRRQRQDTVAKERSLASMPSAGKTGRTKRALVTSMDELSAP